MTGDEKAMINLNNLSNNVRDQIIISNVEKTAILFEVYEKLIDFFEEKPEELVNISFSFDKNNPKDFTHIDFKTSLNDGCSMIPEAFHFLYKCVSISDPLKNPFSSFAMCLIQNTQQVDLTLYKDNIDVIFKYYADVFDGKEEWLMRMIHDHDYTIVSHHPLWGKYPTTVFNQLSYDLWQEVKSRECFSKSLKSY